MVTYNDCIHPISRSPAHSPHPMNKLCQPLHHHSPPALNISGIMPQMPATISPLASSHSSPPPALSPAHLPLRPHCTMHVCWHNPFDASPYSSLKSSTHRSLTSSSSLILIVLRFQHPNLLTFLFLLLWSLYKLLQLALLLLIPSVAGRLSVTIS